MSQDKHRGQARRLALLARALAFYPPGIRLNCRGGLSSWNRNLLRLVKLKLVRLTRERTYSAFGPHIRWGYAIVTAAGKAKAQDGCGVRNLRAGRGGVEGFRSRPDGCRSPQDEEGTPGGSPWRVN